MLALAFIVDENTVDALKLAEVPIVVFGTLYTASGIYAFNAIL